MQCERAAELLEHWPVACLELLDAEEDERGKGLAHRERGQRDARAVGPGLRLHRHALWTEAVLTQSHIVRVHAPAAARAHLDTAVAIRRPHRRVAVWHVLRMHVLRRRRTHWHHRRWIAIVAEVASALIATAGARTGWRIPWRRWWRWRWWCRRITGGGAIWVLHGRAQLSRARGRVRRQTCGHVKR